jgi:hypothetical protein
MQWGLGAMPPAPEFLVAWAILPSLSFERIDVVRTLKELTTEICKEIISEHSDWKYIRGAFRKKLFKNCEMLIGGGFSFSKVDTPIKPFVQIEHKPSMELFKSIVGYEHPSSFISFDAVSDFSGEFKKEWSNAAIVYDKAALLRAVPDAKKLSEKFIDISEAKIVIKSMMNDGLFLLQKYYVTSSEKELLLSFPPKYAPKFSHDFPPGLSGSRGVAACVAHIYAGDFEFLKWYSSEDCKTVVPKRVVELDKIYAMLPELMLKYRKQ